MQVLSLIVSSSRGIMWTITCRQVGDDVLRMRATDDVKEIERMISGHASLLRQYQILNYQIT